MENVDFFRARVIDIGSSKGVIIPSNNIKFAGLEEGDIIKIWFEKLHKKG